MPAFLTPLHEFNQCHSPAGSSAGGQFCSGEGGGVDAVGHLEKVDTRGMTADELRWHQQSISDAKYRKGLTGGGDTSLPEAPGRYFLLDKQTVMVPLDQMDTTRARPEGIAKAEPYMRKAYEGTHTKRKPITLRKKPNGRYEVVDGNSTTAIARKHGWTSLPAHLVD